MKEDYLLRHRAKELEKTNYEFTNSKDKRIFDHAVSYMKKFKKRKVFKGTYFTPKTNFYFYFLIHFKAVGFLGIYILISYKISSKKELGKLPKVLLYIPMTSIFMITFIVGYADVYRRLGIVNEGVQNHFPLDALYFSIVTWTTLGYGDFSPTADGRMVASFEALFGLFFMACFVGFLVNILSADKK